MKGGCVVSKPVVTYVLFTASVLVPVEGFGEIELFLAFARSA